MDGDRREVLLGLLIFAGLMYATLLGFTLLSDWSRTGALTALLGGTAAFAVVVVALRR